MSNLPAPPPLRTRKPTGVIPWPKILIEGEEKAGKSFTAAAFTGCERVGQAYWLELGEDTADEYIGVPGADYVIIEHNGTYRDILGQLEAVHAEARRAAANHEPPVVLVIDSMSLLWRMLVNWTAERARRSRAGQKKLRYDPDAEIKPGMNLWVDAGERWNRVMYLVRTMPGIVLLLARGKEIAAVDDRGEPIPDTKEWKVEAQKSLGFDATVWVRLKRAEPGLGEVIAARSLRFSVPRDGAPLRMPQFSVENLVFERMGCSIHTQPRPAPELAGDLGMVWLPKVKKAAESGVEALGELWKKAATDEELSRDELRVVRAAIEAKAAELKQPERLEDPTSEAARLRAAAATHQQDGGDEAAAEGLAETAALAL
ncbi:hypothetical protein ACFW6V_28995 [Streptomyces sp. NPDC058734]|uniref:hypothetical protein n=1 Tax=Streptomyces sp. NPDC058734 TaxID=3346615 RepID=UPI0036AECB4F